MIMTIQKVSRRATLILLAVCLLGSTLLGALPVPASAEETTTTVYFLNSDNWTTVGAHAWNGDGSLTGDWGSTTAVADEGK